MKILFDFMLIIKRAEQLKAYLHQQKLPGKKAGFVPTMGALHQGHLSLIDKSRKENDITVCSVFVNPTQFNNPDDLKKYPVTVDRDIYWLEKHQCDILFLPPVEEIYPRGTTSSQQYDIGFLEKVLEGKYRPGHFQGVCQVVHRLLDIIKPQTLYLGQKDFQQCLVIKKMIELLQLNELIKLDICPTVRETDGLAMSSRNMRLNDADRTAATAIYKALHLVKKEINTQSLPEVKSKAENLLQEHGFRIDYVEVADADTLEKVENWSGNPQAVVLIAAFLGEVRLIDNLLLN